MKVSQNISHTKSFLERENLRNLIYEMMNQERAENDDRAVIRTLELTTDAESLRKLFSWQETKDKETELTSIIHSNRKEFINGWSLKGVYEDESVRLTFLYRVKLIKNRSIAWNFKAESSQIQEDRPSHRKEDDTYFEGHVIMHSDTNHRVPDSLSDRASAKHLIDQALERVCDLIQSGDMGRNSKY